MSTSGEHGTDGEDTTCAPDAAPYVLGALSEQEHAAFLVHLESCAVCREEVAELQMVADALPAVVTHLKAPPQLRKRILASVAAEPGVEQRLAAARERARARTSSRRQLPWRRFAARPAIALAGLAAAGAAIVLAVLALAGGGGGGSAATRVIRAEVLARGASASLVVKSDAAQLQISGMPQTAPRRVYEVWVKRGGAPQPTDALFTVTRSGAATVGIPGGIAGVKAVLVTSEPLGGSRVPTTSPLIVAHVS